MERPNRRRNQRHSQLNMELHNKLLMAPRVKLMVNLVSEVWARWVPWVVLVVWADLIRWEDSVDWVD
jgi:hypothetical protein